MEALLECLPLFLLLLTYLATANPFVFAAIVQLFCYDVKILIL